MFHWRPVLLVVALVLLLSACAPKSNNQPEVVQAAQLPTVTQNPALTAKAEASTRSSIVGPTDSTAFPQDPPSVCPVTRPPDPPFTPPQPYSPDGPFPSQFWYGTDALWTAIPRDGVWSALPHNPEGYTQKVFWWRNGYSWTEEPEPQLSVTGRRLDMPAPPLNVSRATNAFAADIGSAMLVGVDFPTLGCWEITGHYADTELSFVVWVAP